MAVENPLHEANRTDASATAQHPESTNGNGLPSGTTPLTYGTSEGAEHADDAQNPSTKTESVPNGEGQAPFMEPIAICGMAMRFPGGVRTAEDFWDMLYNKRSGRCRVPANRYNADAFYGPGKIGHIACKYGYFLDDLDLANADASFWSMTKQEIAAMDPQQRLMLEMVYECLQNAGQKPDELRGKRVGVYVGTFQGDWMELDCCDPQNYNMYRSTGYGDYMSANRIHYEFGFTGPSVTIRTACSSSLTGLYDACHAIHAGECDSAVVACANLIFSPRTTITLQEQGLMSPNGLCKTFDANADGYARGEAVSAVYVKSLFDAIRDGDPIRSIIRSTAINAGGKASSLTAPSTIAHENLIRRVHEVAGITDFSKTAMIECHGTGTSIGDPIEAKAVANVFGEWGCYIGSVKTNLGHSEGASGLSSIIKMTLALENKTIPPNLNFTTPNPEIPFEGCKLKVPTEPLRWPADKKELVGVNSFGIGGSNAHVLLESAYSFGISRHRVPTSNEVNGQLLPRLLYFSAKHPEALKRMIANHESYLSSHSGAIDDMAYSLANKRETLTHRAFVVADGESRWETSLLYRPGEKTTPRKVFVFSGQGAQYPQMCKTLITQVSSFQDSIRDMDRVLQALPSKPNWRLVDEILRPKKTSRLSEAELSQPCTTAIQIALVDLLSAHGINAEAVIGHSSGEIAGAYTAGALSSAEAITIAYQRGRVMTILDQSKPGGMAAVGLSREAVEPFLKTGVLIGCENSPESVTLTGDKVALEEVLQEIRTSHPGVVARALQVDRAYHSHHMEAVAHIYRDSLPKEMQARKPTVPFFSSVYCRPITEAGELGPDYWVKNLVSPVLFSPAAAVLLRNIPVSKLFTEIGPHSALAGPLRQILRHHESSDDYMSSLIRGNDAHTDILKVFGEMWLRGVNFEASSVVPKGNFLTDLPLYPWHYEEPLWHESRLAKEWRLRKYPHHDILGSRVLETSDNSPSWRNVLRLDVVSWIKEHEVGDEIVFPGVGYICMAGEAIRQLTGAEDFTARKLHIKHALVMSPGVDVEVVTRLERVRLTPTLDSEWYDFTIYSLSRGTWIRHIFGQVRGGSEQPKEIPTIEQGPRELSRRAWYRKMRQQGLSYGPRFMGLRDMSAHPMQKRVIASLDNDIREGESHYAVHPVTMDCWIQAMAPAVVNGLTRRKQPLSIPTYIGEVYVRPPAGEMILQTTADDVSKSTLSGEVVVVSGGKIVGEMKGLQLSSIGDYEDEANKDPCAAVELEWKKDVNVLDLKELMRPARDRVVLHKVLDEFAALCIIEADSALRDVAPPANHLEKFKSWLSSFVESIPSGGYATLENGAQLANLESSIRHEKIQRMLAELQGTDAGPTAAAIFKLSQNIARILTGQVDELALLLEDESLHRIYDFGQNTDYAELIDLLAHRKPNFRVLEIGAGTGGTTATLLPLLKSSYGERMYLDYTYTDISAGFFIAAKERFGTYDSIEYKVLDIALDPLEQGFEAESYDLVVACNVLHATPSLQKTLRNVRKLIQPHGHLLLQELDPKTKWINFIMGVLPGWWLGDADSRPLEPYVSASRWQNELRAAGFDHTDAVVHDGYLNNNIISRPSSESLRVRRVSVLHNDDQGTDLQQIQELLLGAGFAVDTCTLSDIPMANQDIVSILDLAGPFLHQLDEARFVKFVKFVAAMKESGMLWVTAACQVACRDQRYSMILGLTRVLRTEMSLEIAVLELDNFDLRAFSTIPAVLGQFHDRINEPNVDPTSEWATVRGELLVSRYHYIHVGHELKSGPPRDSLKKLEQHRPGRIDTLYWKAFDNSITPAAGEVMVDIRAVGFNTKDLLVASGDTTEQSSVGRGFGYESSGVVTALGLGVSGINVGDRVIVSCSGSFATRAVVDERLCAAMPDSMTFEEGATMSLAYCTAIYSLVDAAHLKKGESILIRDAFGGVGVAAIHMAKLIGAEIYCALSNEVNIEFLQTTFGISRDRIFSSGDINFQREVMKATNGRGVDMVLNSLPCETHHASWDCLAEFGRFVEIGRHDFIGPAKLAAEALETNRTFTGLDLFAMSTQRPKMIRDLMTKALNLYKLGHIQAIAPLQCFEAVELQDVFRTMQKAAHIGKIVVRMPQDSSVLHAEAEAWGLKLRTDRAYLFAGGLGGIGKAMSTWLVEKGAKHLIFLSRSAGNISDDHTLIRDLHAQGCTATCVSGSVSNYDDVVRAIKSTSLPVGGVFQGSMVLKDGNFVDMDWEQWQAAVEPKVAGTWNLHNALLQQKEPLDHFFLFSSAGAMFGQWGQSNYNAGNTFLDAFVQYRHSLGLPASVVNIGVIEDVGYVNDNPAILDSLRATAQYLVREPDLLSSIELMLRRSSPSKNAENDLQFVNHSQIGIGVRSTLPITADNNRTIWRKDPRMLVYRNLEGSNSTATAGDDSCDAAFKLFLKSVSSNVTLLHDAGTALRLAQEIGRTLFEFLMRGDDFSAEKDMQVSLVDVGIDSLISIEIRNWIRRTVGVEFTVLEIVKSENIKQIGEKAQAKLIEKLEATM